MAPLSPDDPGREHDAAEITVVGVSELDRCVPEDRIVDPRLHPLDLVARVDAAHVPVLAAHGERDLRAPLYRLRAGVVGSCRFQEAVRRGPDLHGPFFDGRGLCLRRGLGAGGGAGGRRHVPGVRAADDLDDALCDRGGPGAIRLDDLDSLHLHLRGRRLVVDAGGEALEIEGRPGKRGIRGLAELEPSAGTRVLDGPRVGGRERRLGGGQRAGRFAGAAGRAGRDQGNNGESGESAHGHTSIA